MDRTKRGLNWGCGSVIADDWINVDPDPALAPVVDARDTNDFADGCFDGIVANHSLQCLAYDELDPAVRELHRILRPGGRLRVLVPDVLAAFYAYEEEDADWPGFVAITEDWSLDRKFAHYLTWGGSNRSTFTEESLLHLLRRHGLQEAEWWAANHKIATKHDWSWLAARDSRPGESIVVEMVKP